MALNKATLKTAIENGIKALNTQMATGNGITPDAYASSLADCIANAVDAFVKSGDVGGTKTLAAPGDITLANTSGPVTGSATVAVTNWKMT